MGVDPRDAHEVGSLLGAKLSVNELQDRLNDVVQDRDELSRRSAARTRPAG